MEILRTLSTSAGNIILHTRPQPRIFIRANPKILNIYYWKSSENLAIKLRSDIYCQVTTEVLSFRFDFFVCFVYFQEWDPCLPDAIKAEPAPVPKVFNFFALTAYQTSYLYKRSNLCPKLTYGRVKKITEDSGK